MDIKSKNLLFAATAAAVLAGGAGVFAGRTLFPATPTQAGSVDNDGAGKADDPGKAPEGAADEKSEAGAGGGSVKLDDEGVSAADIDLVTLAPGSLMEEIVAQGTVAAAPDGEAVLTAGAAGTISQIRKRLGDPVVRGETIAVVTSAEAAALSAALSTAKAKLELAQSSFDREQHLFDAKITARQELEAAQAELGEAKAELRRGEAAAKAARVSGDGASVVITSPIAGRITFVADSAKLGAFVAPETALFRIADPARIQVQAAVPAADAQRIKHADVAEIETAAGQKIAATVWSVTPGVDVESRSATVVLGISGPQGAVQPGQFVRVWIRPHVAAATEAGFVLPEEAVQNVAGRDVVFVREGNTFKPTPVRVGSRAAGRVEIVSGLDAGQIVAGRNAFLLKAELGKSNEED